MSYITLDASTATLRATYNTHSTLSNVLDSSKHLLTALEKSDWVDRLLVLSGLFFFFMVVLFILKQRILDKGLRIALFWTRFIPDFTADEELLKGDLEKGRGVVEGVVTALSTAVASAASTAAASATPSLDVVQTLSTIVSSTTSPAVDTGRTVDPTSTSHDEL
jgi:protein transport protein SEC20